MAIEIGALRALLSLDSAAFETGASRARASMSGLKRAMHDTGQTIAKVGATMAKGFTAAVAAAGAGAIATGNSLAELSRQAQLAGLSAQELKVLSLAARQVGVEQDKMSDILKDVNDKVGDFLSTGAGPMKDFFENIAPLVGVTVEQFKGLNSADALQLYVSSLEKANVSQAEMTFYMEAIANDATALVPIFKNNGAAIAEMTARAAELGLVLDQNTIEAAKSARGEFSIVADVLKTKLSVAFADLLPAVARLAEVALPALKSVIDVVADLIDGLAKLLSGDFRGAWEIARNSIVAMLDAMASLIADIGPKIAEIVAEIGRALIDGIKGLAASVAQAALDLGGSLVDGLKSGISNKIDGLKSTVTDAAQSVIGWWRDETETRSPSRVFARLGGYLMDGLSSGIKDGLGDVRDSIGYAADAITNVFDGVLFKSKSFGDALKGVLSGIGRGLFSSGLSGLGSMIGKSAGGPLGKFAAALFPSFDGGGYTGLGGRSGGLDGLGGFLAMMHPNETVIDHTKRQSGAPARVDVRVSVDDNGNLRAFVQRESARVTTQAMGAMNRALPDRMQQISRDPMARA